MTDLTHLFDDHKDTVYRFLRYQLQSHEDACDGVQEVFLRAWKAWNGYRREANPRTWLLSIARYYAIDVIRKRRRNAIDFVDHVPDQPSPDAPASYRLELEETLATLRPNYRQVFLLRCIEDLPIQEVARILGWTSARVQVTYFRAVRELRVLLADEDPGEDVNVR